jgi:DNA-binding NtrC family response regulator
MMVVTRPRGLSGEETDRALAPASEGRAPASGREDKQVLRGASPCWAFMWDAPGNLRELRNAVERAVILCHGGLLTREHLPMTVARPPAAATAPEAEFPAGGVESSAVERELLQKALAQARQQVQGREAARPHLRQLYALLRRHGLTDARR